MKVLGLTAPISVNTAACLVADGRLVAFAEEERFTGVKHAPRLVPKEAIRYCLKEGGISIDTVDAIALGFDGPFRGWAKSLWENLREGNVTRGFFESGAYAEYIVNMVRTREFLGSLSEADPRGTIRKIRFVSHHLAHAASAARCSGFETCNILSLDGVGENEAGFLGAFKENKIEKFGSIRINQSLGWLYTLVTGICGFTEHSHEGKTMALAAFGTPDLSLLKDIAELREDGYILHRNWYRTIYATFGPKRQGRKLLTQKHKNLAATVQGFLEEAGLRLARALHRRTGHTDLVLAGGVALNCDMNAKLLGSGFVDRIFIQPAANDAGTALGAAYEWYAEATGRPCEPLTHAYYGPQYSDAEIESLLKDSKLRYRRIASLAEVAERLASGKIVGWFQGRMEFGPRALGNRSILAHPGLPGMKDKINREVKHRAAWRPFAPSVLADRAPEYFERYRSSPFMLLTFATKKEKLADIAAAVHTNGTARVQEVTEELQPRYHELITAFAERTGIPAVLNTSFNDQEKPIVLTPRDALQTFFTTGLDVLVLNDFLLTKERGET